MPCHAVKHAHATAKYASKKDYQAFTKTRNRFMGGFARKYKRQEEGKVQEGSRKPQLKDCKLKRKYQTKEKDTTRNRLARVFTRSRCFSESRQGTERGTSEAKAASEHKNEHTSSSNNMENLPARMTCNVHVPCKIAEIFVRVFWFQESNNQDNLKRLSWLLLLFFGDCVWLLLLLIGDCVLFEFVLFSF